MQLLLFIPILLLLGWVAYTDYVMSVVLLAALLPTYLLRTSVGPIPTTLLELSILTVSVMGLLQPAVRQKWYQAARTVPWPIWLASVGWLLAATISAVISAEPRVSWGIWKSWIVTPMIFGWLVYAVADTVEVRQKVWRSLQWSGLAVAIVGISQLGSLSRITSVYDVPNSLALFLAPLLVAAIWQRQWWSSSVLLLATVATQSIGALIAVAVTLVIGHVVWRGNYKPARFIWKSGLVTGVIILMYLTWSGRITYILQPLTNGTPTSSSVRLQLWQASVDLLKQQPILGLGLGQFEPAYQVWVHQKFTRYEQGIDQVAPLPEFVFRDPHNWIFSMWLNVGLVGLLSWLFWHAYALGRGYQQRQNLATIDQATWLALVSLLVIGLVDTIYWKNDLAALQWLVIALSLRSFTNFQM